MDLSIVIPVYNELEALTQLCDGLEKTLAHLPSSEIMFADVGSTDGSAAKLHELAHSNPRIRIVCFRGDYGRTAALMTGHPRAITTPSKRGKYTTRDVGARRLLCRSDDPLRGGSGACDEFKICCGCAMICRCEK